MRRVFAGHRSQRGYGARAATLRFAARCTALDIVTLVKFVAGLVLLVFGAEWLVRGASRLAAGFGISPLVIGLTVVAFGTSSPELAVSLGAAWSGQADMAVGNVVGSNIFNVLFILGASAVITPLLVAQDLVRRDVPLVVAASVVVWLLAADGAIGRFDGILLFLALVAYTWWLVAEARRDGAAPEFDAAELTHPQASSLPKNLGFVVAGLALLVLGSQWLVAGAVQFAQWLGVSEVVIGLTIVAAGTSLPEVATSLLAAIRGQRDIAVGNVVGSNAFNLLGVLGLSGAIAPGGLPVQPSMVTLDLPVMLAAAVACLPLFARGRMIPRWQGVAFLAFYVAYTVYLVLDATKHEAKAGYGTVMLRFVVPLTVMTMTVLAMRVLKGPGAAGADPQEPGQPGPS